MKLSLVIPMYNEEKIIIDTLEKTSAYMRENFGEDCEIIFSNDGSTDNCPKMVESFADPIVRLVGYKENQGKGCAIRTGMLAAKGDVVIFTDCDLAYGLDVVKEAFEIFAGNPEADMVIGSRNLTDDGYEGYTFIRKLVSKAYIKLLAIAAGFELSDSQCGFKCFRLDTVKKIFPSCEVNGFAFDFEVIIKAKKASAKIVQMPVKVINHRESKIHFLRDSLRMLKDIRKIKKRNK